MLSVYVVEWTDSRFNGIYGIYTNRDAAHEHLTKMGFEAKSENRWQGKSKDYVCDYSGMYLLVKGSE